MVLCGDPIRSDSSRPCVFRFDGVQAASVALVGTFNQWSTTAHLMTYTNGQWEAQVVLPPGKHSYCFFALKKDHALRGSLYHMGSTIDIGGQSQAPISEASGAITSNS